MAYKNYNNYSMSAGDGSRSYGQRGYSRGDGPRNGARWGSAYNSFRNNRTVSDKPHSGCTVRKNHETKSGAKKLIVINGWKYTKKTGMMSFVATAASDKYQKGRLHVTMVVTWTSQQGQSTLWGHWNPDKQILSIPDLRIVASGVKNYVSYLKPKGFK